MSTRRPRPVGKTRATGSGRATGSARPSSETTHGSTSKRPVRRGVGAASARPKGRLQGRTGAAPAVTMRPPAGLSRRAAVLMLVIAAILVMLAPVLRAFISQQQRLSAMEASVSSSQSQVDSLQSQIDRWHDDAFVKAQARARFGFVMPGEMGYIVLGNPPSVNEKNNPSAAAAAAAAASKGPWFNTLWASVQAAGQATP